MTIKARLCVCMRVCVCVCAYVCVCVCACVSEHNPPPPNAAWAQLGFASEWVLPWGAWMLMLLPSLLLSPVSGWWRRDGWREGSWPYPEAPQRYPPHPTWITNISFLNRGNGSGSKVSIGDLSRPPRERIGSYDLIKRCTALSYSNVMYAGLKTMHAGRKMVRNVVWLSQTERHRVERHRVTSVGE